MTESSRATAERGVRCDYCHGQATLIGGNEMYPHRRDLFDKKFWKCEPCQAWVGCHPGTVNPLGRLANAELRIAKSRVHAKLDPLWKSGRMKRKDAYALLAGKLNIAPQNCHVGMFDVPTCDAAYKALTEAK